MIQLPKLCESLILMAEHFDDLLPFHQLLDAAVERPKIALLLHKIASA